MNWLKNRGLNFKVALGIMTTMLLVLGAVVIGATQYIRARLWESELQKVEDINAIAKTYLEEAMLSGRKDTIEAALNNLGQNVGHQELNSIAVYDDRFILTAFASGFPGGPTVPKESMPSSVQDPTCWGCHQYPPQQRPTHLVVESGGRQFIRNSVTLYNTERCQSCHGTDTRVLGDIIVDYSQDQFQQSYTTIASRLIFGMIAAIVLVTLVLYQTMRLIVLRPVEAIVRVTDRMSSGNLEQQMFAQSDDEIGILIRGINNMGAQLRELISSLEQRVSERTNELQVANQHNQRRAQQFEAIVQVSRVISQTQNLQDVLPQIAQVISQYFDYYHTGIFLIDTKREYAVLSAANSEGGQRMLDRNHKLRVGQVGIVGYVAETGKARVALDTGEDAIFFNNPDLPETRSEMALPLLQTNGQIIGVLDIQSTEPDAFNRETIDILTMLADLVSVSISNARLYEETQKNLIEAEMLYRRDVQTGWKKFTRIQKISGIRRVNMRASIYSDPLEIPGAEEVVQSGTARVVTGRQSQVTLPVKLRGETIGMLNVKSDTERKWTSDEMDIVTAIVERAALSIENARLLAESRRAAEKERVVGEISARVSSYTNRDNILQAAVAEIGRALPGAEVILQIQNSGNDESLR